jgi:thiol-disulfide isomerase/thioredoxin
MSVAHHRRLGGGGLVVVLVVVLVVGLSGPMFASGCHRPRTSISGQSDGKPSLRFPRWHGGQWDLRSERGRVVLINYFATWCAPCIAEWPLLIEMQNRYGTAGLSIIAVSMDTGGDAEQVLEAFLGHFDETNFPIMRATEATFGGHPWAIGQLPTTIIIDRQGRPIGKWEGMLPAQETEALLLDLVLDQGGR